MFIETEEMYARRGAIESFDTASIYYPINEGSGGILYDSIGGSVYTPTDFSWDTESNAAGAIVWADSPGKEVIIGDHELVTEDFSYPSPITFDKDIVFIAAGRWIQGATYSLHCTIGLNTTDGAIGTSFEGGMHVVVRGADGSNGAPLAWSNINPTPIANDTEVIIVMTYDRDGNCYIGCLDETGTVLSSGGVDFEDTAANTADPGLITINNKGRIHGLAYRGMVWCSVDGIPSNVVSVATWLASQWRQGRKVLCPRMQNWA